MSAKVNLAGPAVQAGGDRPKGPSQHGYEHGKEDIGLIVLRRGAAQDVLKDEPNASDNKGGSDRTRYMIGANHQRAAYHGRSAVEHRENAVYVAGIVRQR